MNIHTFQLGDLQTNTYILEEDGKVIIIDPADDASFITEEIQRRRWRPLALYGTHGHFDHMLAVGELQENFSIPYYIHPRDRFLIDRASQTARHFLKYDPVILPPKSMTQIQEGDNIIYPFTFRVLFTPGHTPGSVTFYFKDEQSLFVGDTLFRGSVGRADFSYADKSILKKSLQVLFEFPPETIVYPGHGELTSIGAEKKGKG